MYNFLYFMIFLADKHQQNIMPNKWRNLLFCFFCVWRKNCFPLEVVTIRKSVGSGSMTPPQHNYWCSCYILHAYLQSNRLKVRSWKGKRINVKRDLTCFTVFVWCEVRSFGIGALSRSKFLKFLFKIIFSKLSFKYRIHFSINKI